MSEHLPLGRTTGGEFRLIDEMRAHWGPLAVGIGDDAAVLTVPRGEQLVASTDAAVEGVHFKRDWLSVEQIAYRAVTAALSDLAAMGASPLGILLGVQLPADLRDSWPALADGAADAVRAAGTVIRGGNVSAASELCVSTTVLGSCYTPLSRKGGRPGDLLYVTGALGGPRAALRALQAESKVPPALLARFARPSARIAEARWLASHGCVAAIDISDGIVSDAAHLAAANGVRVEIDARRVPVWPGALADDALAGGEEYELLVAMRTPPNADEFSQRFGIPLTPVGRLLEGPAEVHIVHDGGRVASPSGHDHYFR